MTDMSDFLENELLDHSLAVASWTSPANVYCALFTASTGLESNSPSAEVSGGAYARVAITFSVASGGTTSNSAAITFTTATANWGTVSHVAIMDASSAGNVLYWGALSSSVAVNTDYTFEIAIGDLDVTLD
jgi:hypothetical protein